MQRFLAMTFAVVVESLCRAEATVTIHGVGKGPRDPMPRDAVDQIRGAAAAAAKLRHELPVSRSLEEQLDRLKTRLDGDCFDDDMGRAACVTALQEARLNLVHEFMEHLFFMIPVESRAMYEQPQPLFGSEVADRFDQANTDIADAGRCLALDQWTAAVFHLMRVVEHGLTDLAARLGVSANRDNWQNVIEQINKQITDMGKLPKSDTKSAQLDYYSRATVQISHFKNAWRNHVAHARATYDEREAFSVFSAVRDFMQQIAKPIGTADSSAP